MCVLFVHKIKSDIYAQKTSIKANTKNNAELSHLQQGEVNKKLYCSPSFR